MVYTQDWYDIRTLSAIGEKVKLITKLCNSQMDANSESFALNYTNGSSFPLALPPAVAKGILGSNGTPSLQTSWQLLAVQGVNVRLRDYIADLHMSQALSEQPPRDTAHFWSKGRSKKALLPVTFALDYYDFVPDLVPLLIDSNF